MSPYAVVGVLLMCVAPCKALATKTVSGGQGADLSMSCDAGNITIQRAYVSGTCGSELAMDTHTSKAGEVCNGQATCTVGYNGGGNTCASCTDIRMSDPCPGTPKTLYVDYTCQAPTPSAPAPTPAHSVPTIPPDNLISTCWRAIPLLPWLLLAGELLGSKSLAYF